ncbi:60S ribosomal protein L24 [Tulasnella sp. 424]|nr:60S ribosomal protein L24 [Tulasnella sp. 424]
MLGPLLTGRYSIPPLRLYVNLKPSTPPSPPKPATQIFRFAKPKHESMFKQRKNPRVIAWTQVYRRQHRKGVADQVQKKKSRKTVKSQRGYAGMSLTDLAAKKAESPAARLEARQAAINKAKLEKKATATKDGKPKGTRPAGQASAPKVSKQQMKNTSGKGGR